MNSAGRLASGVGVGVGGGKIQSEGGILLLEMSLPRGGESPHTVLGRAQAGLRKDGDERES